MLFKDLLDPPICVRESELGNKRWTPFPEETVTLATAVDKRRREFAAGRACARQAFAALGLPSVAIPSGPDRAPIWPLGVVGSITHSSSWCVAAVALQSDGFISIGVDIEEAIPLEEAFASDICTRFEIDWLERQPVGRRGLLLKAVFSAKECAYKCQYPLTKKFLEYDAMCVELDADAGWFSAHFEIDVHPFKAGSRLDGRISFAGSHIATALALR
jgi:4'-phosphopantetheinyl transferase EntD